MLKIIRNTASLVKGQKPSVQYGFLFQARQARLIGRCQAHTAFASSHLPPWAPNSTAVSHALYVNTTHENRLCRQPYTISM